MGKINKAVQQMIDWANDPSHGYDQIYRWGEKGDYDCSSSIIEALEKAGIPAKSNGATYTGNMYGVLTKLGFKDVTDKVVRATGEGIILGDVLLNHVNHVAMSIGGGKLVQASINELGTATGGQPGDQTGTEFYIRDYYDYPWDCVLRYVEAEIGGDTGAEKGNVNAPNKGGRVPHSDLVVECACRMKEDTICRTGVGNSAPKAKLFPMVRKGALVDLIRGTKVVDDKGDKWCLIRIAHPTEGFVTEYVPYVNIARFSTKSS